MAVGAETGLHRVGRDQCRQALTAVAMMVVTRPRLMVRVRAIVVVGCVRLIAMMMVFIKGDVAERQMRVAHRSARLMQDAIDDTTCRPAGERKREHDAQHRARALE